MRASPPTAILLALCLMAAAMAGCGSSGGDPSVPGGADPDAVAVIKSWSDELRSGDVQAASARFQIPSVVQNGTPALTLMSRRDVVTFNESLPCGAKLTRAETRGRFTIATFELTERPGPGECGAGVGAAAQTAFAIDNGRISEWRRVADAPSEPPSEGPVI